jgi:hypothetical protein
VAQALIAHVFAQDAAIGDDSRDCDAHVVVNLEHFFIGTGELILGFVERGQHHMGFALQTTAMAECFSRDSMWRNQHSPGVQN